MSWSFGPRAFDQAVWNRSFVDKASNLNQGGHQADKEVKAQFLLDKDDKGILKVLSYPIHFKLIHMSHKVQLFY